MEEKVLVDKKIVDAEEKLKDLHKNWQSFLRDRVNAEDIAEIISKWTGIPVNKMLTSEKQRILEGENVLKKDVIGQDEALKTILKMTTII